MTNPRLVRRSSPEPAISSAIHAEMLSFRIMASRSVGGHAMPSNSSATTILTAVAIELGRPAISSRAFAARLRHVFDRRIKPRLPLRLHVHLFACLGQQVRDLRLRRPGSVRDRTFGCLKSSLIHAKCVHASSYTCFGLECLQVILRNA